MFVVLRGLWLLRFSELGSPITKFIGIVSFVDQSMVTEKGRPLFEILYNNIDVTCNEKWEMLQAPLDRYSTTHTDHEIPMGTSVEMIGNMISAASPREVHCFHMQDRHVSIQQYVSQHCNEGEFWKPLICKYIFPPSCAGGGT